MRTLVTGSHGLVGTALLPVLEAAGHPVTRLVRGRPQSGEIAWNPPDALDPAALEGFDAVIHLAGENIAGRWTPAKKARIRDSRLQGTRVLATALARMQRKPRVLIQAAAIGIYGNRGDEWITEDMPPGTDFLSHVGQDWESAARSASQAGIRVVALRTGIVLSAQGGALAKMLPPFRIGLGGRIGSGQQYMSWIVIDDLVGVFLHALTSESLRGSINAVAPNPVTNSEFTRTLGQVLGRPTLLPVPEFVVKAIFGEMGEALLLGSQRVSSAALQASGYCYLYRELKPALQALLS